MKKNKDGKIIASLTEVKNKTGDIFALADEYGEVTLTSYNKPRYKIIKLNISALLEDVNAAPKAKKSTVQTLNKVQTKVVEPKLANAIHVENPSEDNKLINKTFIINEWERDSLMEQEFVANITKTLI